MPEKLTFRKSRESGRTIRKTLIMEAVQNLFKRKPFHEIGMREIASEAGISAATIYRYFPSQDHLYIEVLIQDIKKIEQVLKTQLDKEHNSVDDLAITIVDYLFDNEATFQMLCHFMIIGGINPGVLSKFNTIQIYFLNMFEEMVKNKGVSRDIRFFSQAFFATLAGVVMTFLHYPGLSKNEKRAHMHKLVLLIIRKGRFRTV